MVDLSVYDKIVGYSQIPEQNRAKQFEIDMLRRKQYLEEQKAQEIDVDKLGEQAFMKAAMGVELSPQELAAAQYVDAKSGGIVFDPVTGQTINKPRISDKIGLGLGGQSMQSPGNKPTLYQQSEQNFENNKNIRKQPPALSSGSLPLDEAAGIINNEPSEIDRIYQAQLQQAQGNRRLQQEISKEYMKKQAELKAAAPQALARAQNIYNTISQLEQHPGLSDVVGIPGWTNPYGYALPASKSADFKAKYAQLQGQSFLQAYDQLKGAGAISEIEGLKAQNAIASLSLSQSEEEFKKSLKDLKDVVVSGMNRIKGVSGSTYPTNIDNRQSNLKDLSNEELMAIAKGQ